MSKRRTLLHIVRNIHLSYFFRIEGRVQRFDYGYDYGFEVNNFLEKEIMTLANDNKVLRSIQCS